MFKFNKIKDYLSLNKFITELLLVSLVIVLSILLRAYKIDTIPGYEWDELVYAQITLNYLTYGYPTLKPEGYGKYVPYLYHPPFDSWIKSRIFKVTNLTGITGSRIVSIFSSAITFLLIYFIFREVTSKKVAFISLLLIATDGWLIYTNRLNIMENIMFVLGVASIGVYLYATQHKKKLFYLITGILLGLTVIYKHTGIYFLAIPIFYLIFTKRDYKYHSILFISSVLVVSIYLLLMYLTWGNLYLEQTSIQIQRTLGIINSRGLNYSFNDALNALVQTYWIYFTTIIALITGTILVFKNTLKFILTRVKPKDPLLLSWSVASLLFLGSISLRAPQYLVIALLPIYIYLTVEIIPWITYQKKKTLLYIFLSLILILNAITWDIRFIKHQDNALLDTYNYVNNNISGKAIILTEESIGVGIKQIYYRLDAHNTKTELDKIKPTYIIIYISSTQKPPKSEALKNLIKQARLEKEIKGFKETILIYCV